ncbi:MAG: histidine phosphatase family protein [Betaproteobacteria bacterium AqS2]|uniref:Histidine phosphatase family protein n=1 Tax=Candidatus Amphirhobacter heronislandensis TaxID=1732024 RepID=A0A930UDG3_9GAMM|nr:histidine phosphatase family protein [Betaproteobacteria bacterium AqS2]
MPRLLVLRHAAAEADGGTGGDFARALTPAGQARARRFGELLAGRGLRPELAIVSAARRAEATAAAVLDGLGPPAPVLELDRRFHNCQLDVWLERLRAVDEAVATTLVVGHEPAMAGLAMRVGAPPLGLALCECWSCVLPGPWAELGGAPGADGVLLRAD